jgi:pimeloyl-ACP methyl ester carboxylesterase
MSKVLIALAVLVAALLIFVLYVTRDGKLVTPQGRGTLSLPAGDFEAFPLPAYAAEVLTPDYKSYFVEVEPGIKVHVLETGRGYPVFMQHGNPTSGLLYRKIAARLPTDRMRLIMPTLVGFGFSSKVPASRHSVDNHNRWIHSALSQLELKELVFVGQDWGGPIGMGALAHSPDLIKGAVILNTGFWAPDEAGDISELHARLKRPVLGEFIVETLNGLYSGFARLQAIPEAWPENAAQLYFQPLFDDGNKKSPLAMARLVPDGPDHRSAESFRFVERYVDTLEIPAEIVWGTKDRILGHLLEQMKGQFPDARVTVTQAGHFLQEEAPDEIAEAILRVVDAVQLKQKT